MKPSNYKYLITIIFIFFGEQIAAENRIIINFESPPSLNQEAKLIQNIKNYISDKIGLNVSIKNNKKNKGTITFAYHDIDQLNKIIDIIKSNY